MERNKKRKKNRSNWSLIGDPGALRREEGGHEPLTVHEIIPPPPQRYLGLGCNNDTECTRRLVLASADRRLLMVQERTWTGELELVV